MSESEVEIITDKNSDQLYKLDRLLLWLIVIILMIKKNLIRNSSLDCSFSSNKSNVESNSFLSFYSYSHFNSKFFFL